MVTLKELNVRLEKFVVGDKVTIYDSPAVYPPDGPPES